MLKNNIFGYRVCLSEGETAILKYDKACDCFRSNDYTFATNIVEVLA